MTEKRQPWHGTWLPSGRLQLLYRSAGEAVPPHPPEQPAPKVQRGVRARPTQEQLL